MKNVILFSLVAFALGILAMPIAAQSPIPNLYQPGSVRLIEVSGVGISNPTGSLVVALGAATPSPIGNGLVSVTPAFAPVTFGCVQLTSGAQIAQALVAGITVNAGTSGFTATLSGLNRVLISGPQVFEIAIFHAEIDPLYGRLLPVYGLCDGLVGNEQSPTGTGVSFTLVPVSDSQIGSFEVANGTIVPPNFTWNSRGQVSVAATPASGFPTAGTAYLVLNTNDPDPANYPPATVTAQFSYSPSTPRMLFAYRWFNGEGVPSPTSNDAFTTIVRITDFGGDTLVVQEDTFTPLSAGVRYEEVNL